MSPKRITWFIKIFIQYFAGGGKKGKKDRGAIEENNNRFMNIRLRTTILMNLIPPVGIQVMTSIPILIST